MTPDKRALSRSHGKRQESAEKYVVEVRSYADRAASHLDAYLKPIFVGNEC